MKHSLSDLAVKLGVSTTDSFQMYNKGVRDRDDVNAFKCTTSGMIILDNIKPGSKETYIKKNGMEYFQSHAEQSKDFVQPKSFITTDDEKRVETYKEIIRGKKWLDFGCGQGGPSLLLKDVALEAVGVELQPAPRDYLNANGVKCFLSLDQVENEKYDIITMFHVYEHLDDPTTILNNCYEKLAPGGKLIIEVPHANDALLSLYGSEAFKQFTLWSEHLILHTRHSLSRFISDSKFKVDTIKSYQRYPLSNHLYWLSQNKPGGHHAWSFLNTKELESAYMAALAEADKTDTIIAYCSK